MDSVDDDCGELYADVEAQACSAIKAMYIEQEIGSDGDNLSAGEKNSTGKDEEDQFSDESDSEDELKIVVNDDDWENLPETVGDGLVELNGNGERETFGNKRGFNSQFKVNGAAYRSNMRVNGAASSYSCSKGESSGLFSNVYGTANSLHPHYGYFFSHPWYRSILNVDFDSLLEKPWRLAGADVTDFFNFGLNEESWKQYCNSLGKYCRQASLPNTKLYDSSQVNQPQGSAIQVEQSIGERQSSMDVWPTCFQDSDVVIQINLQESILDPFGSIKGERGQSGHEVSKQEIKDAEDDGKFLVSRSAAVDDMSGVYHKENGKVVPSNASRRFLPHKLASDERSSDTGTQENDKIIYEDGDCQQKINVCTSEQSAEAVEIIKAGKGSVLQSDPCLVAKESSLDNGGRLSFSTSCFASDSDDGSLIVQGPLRRAQDSGNELHDSGASDYMSSGRDGRKRMKIDEKPRLRYRSPVRNMQKHQSRESHGSARRNITLKREEKLCPRNKNLNLKNEKKHYGGCSSFTRGKMYTENIINVSPGGRDVNRSSFDSGRWKERSQDCDYYDIEDSSYHIGQEFNRYSQGFSYNRVGHKKNFHLRSGHGFREEIGHCIHKNLGRNYQWRRGNAGQLRKRADNYRFLFDHNDENEEMQDRYGQAFSFTDHETDFSVEPYDRCLQVIEREVKVSGRRCYKYDTAFHPNKSRSMETEVIRDLDSNYFHAKFDQECLTIEGGRPRDTFSHGSRLSQEYLRHFPEICHEEYEESYDDTGITTEDGIMFEDELIVRRHDYGLSAEDSFLIEETSKQDMIHASRGSLQNNMRDDLQFRHPRYRLTRERNGGSCLNINTFSNYRGDDEQMLQNFRGSVNSISREGKFSGRRTNGRRLTRNFWREKMEMDFPRKRRFQTNYQSRKSIKTDILNAEANRNDDKMLQKPSVVEHCKNLEKKEGRVFGQRGKGENASSLGYDKRRILDTMAKMEKRRERFKDLVAVKEEEPEKAIKVEGEAEDAMSGRKLGRRTRKRHWGGN